MSNICNIVTMLHKYYVKANTVGIRKPNMSGFQMVQSCSVMEWSVFQMVFENRTLKCQVLECIQFSNVRFSDPHCSLVPNSDRCYLFRLIQSNKFTLGIAITAILIMEPFKYRAINCLVFRLSVIPLKYLCPVLFRDHSLMMSRN